MIFWVQSYFTCRLIVHFAVETGFINPYFQHKYRKRKTKRQNKIRCEHRKTFTIYKESREKFSYKEK